MSPRTPSAELGRPPPESTVIRPPAYVSNPHSESSRMKAGIAFAGAKGPVSHGWPTRIQTLERIGQQISIRVCRPGKNALALLKQVGQGEAGGHLPKGAVGRLLEQVCRKQRRLISPNVEGSIVSEKMIDRSFQFSSPLPVGLPGHRSERAP